MRTSTASIRVLLVAALIALPFRPCCCHGAEHAASTATAAAADCCSSGDRAATPKSPCDKAPSRHSHDSSCGGCQLYTADHDSAIQPAITSASDGWLTALAFDFAQPAGLVLETSSIDLAQGEKRIKALGPGDSLRALSCLLTI